METTSVRNYNFPSQEEIDKFREEFNSRFQTNRVFWFFLIKITAIFIGITLIIFSVAYRQFLASQFSDFFKKEEYASYVNDLDGDGLPDWWEEKYGLDKNNLVDAKKDNDQDKLNNLLEYQYGADPNNADTDGDGHLDGQEVEDGYNPVGEGRLEGYQEEKPLDLEGDEDGDGLINKYEIFFGTDIKKADTDDDDFDDYMELVRGYDPTVAGSSIIEAFLEVPSIGLKAPIIWLHNFIEKDLEKNLELGLVHYPSSAFPAFQGNCQITGHSSYYNQIQSDYKDILKDIDKIKIGDEIIFHLTFSNERKIEIVYRVAVEGEVVAADDARIFRDYSGHEVTLLTCWPIGTNWKRMMVKADLEKPKW